MVRVKVLLVVVVALVLATAAPAVAVNEASFLREAAGALDAGDHGRYGQLTGVLIHNADVPDVLERAIEEQDAELLRLGADLLELRDEKLYQRAVDALEIEQSMLPSPGEPGSPSAPQGEMPLNLEAARQVDIEGLMILQILDIRELPVPDTAREVLGLMPGPDSGERGPRPVTFESARRELQELVPAVTPSSWSKWALFATGVLTVGLLAAVWTRSRRITRLASLAATDGLTGLNNRRQLDLDLDAQAKNGVAPTALLMIDIDHFTQFNFEHGHTVGDEALRQVARAIDGSVREDDVSYRYGGEEFCVLLPNTDEATAARIGDRVRSAIGAVEVNGTVVTASVGVASGRASDVSHTTIKADRALFAAKESGRNRVAVATRTAL